MKIKEQKEAFVRIDKDELLKLIQLKDTHKSLYLYLCSRITFAHRLYGIYKKETYTTLRNGVNSATKETTYKDITALKRACKQLEKANLIKILWEKDNLIISLDSAAQIEFVSIIIKQDYKSFNLSLKRISEIKTIFGLDFSYFVEVFRADSFKKDSKQLEELVSVF